MSALGDREIWDSTIQDFDEILEKRAEKHESLRGRNNTTSCRSPTRALDTKWMKNELQRKRDLEFQRRRQLSPDPSASTSFKTKDCFISQMSSVDIFSVKPHGLVVNNETTPNYNGRPLVMLTPKSSMAGDDLSTNNWATFWSESIAPAAQEKYLTTKQDESSPVSVPKIKEPTQQTAKASKKRVKKTNGPKKSISKSIQTEKLPQTERSSRQTTTIPQKTVQAVSVQTEPGFITVRESDVQLLADYLQEALWREKALKQKLVALQDSVSAVLHYSKTLWTTRCTEDLLRNKIKALEAQLQVSLQKFPRDGVKKVVLQMEKQKVIYEEKALAALQKATDEKTEAVIETEMLQGELKSAKAEASRWQELYEELRLTSDQLRESQVLTTGQLQQLHSQVELSRVREMELKEAVDSLQRERAELQYNISLLEKNNQILREEIENLRDDSTERADAMVQVCSVPLEEPERNQDAKGQTQLEEQLHHTQDRLELKERECRELQAELEDMEQEFQSSQTRLTQCREELRQLSHRHRSRRLPGSCCRLLVFLLLLLAAVGVAMLWMWHPPFRDQVEDIYLDIQTRVENYLFEMAPPQISGCFRPI